jgi:hypothetical protein
MSNSEGDLFIRTKLINFFVTRHPDVVFIVATRMTTYGIYVMSDTYNRRKVYI